ncbi:MAG TPA: PQQ-binding-like beta-propeller repeat protein, partial [archaeon]|nr:PQQ-binding-like beta-propeller repeat protein [archaeon]
MGYRASYGPIPPITTSTIDVRAFSDVAAAAVNSLIKTANRDPIWGVKAGGSVTCAALVHEGTLYFGAHDGILYALDPLTGKERWRFPTNGPIAGGEFPVIWQDSLLFTSFDHHLYCLARDGALRWKFDAKSKLAATPVVHDGRAYFGSKEGRIFCVDIATGSQRWSFSAQDAVWGPALADGVLYFASWDKHLYALTLDGRLLWKYPSPEQFNWVPAVGRFIYVGGRDNCLSAITPDGKLAWKFRTSGAVVSVP